MKTSVNGNIRLVAEVTIDGKLLTDVQVLTLRAVVQALLVTQPNAGGIMEGMGAQLREINRMLCGEE
jgi:hypothetical protein